MSQEKLAEAIGLTFQQVQKYERGANRIGSSRLFDLARVLDVPVAYFFEDMSPTVAANTPRRMRGFAETKPEPSSLTRWRAERLLNWCAPTTASPIRRCASVF